MEVASTQRNGERCEVGCIAVAGKGGRVEGAWGCGCKKRSKPREVKHCIVLQQRIPKVNYKKRNYKERRNPGWEKRGKKKRRTT